MVRKPFIYGLAALCLGLGGPVGEAQSPPSERSVSSQSSASYRIGRRDRLVIRVQELPDLNSELVVGDDGTINLDVIGSVDVLGLTEQELETRLQARLLQEGLRRATVTAAVAEFRSKPVSVLGAVVRPGNQVIPGRSTLIDLILDAGGLSERAGRKIIVRRRAENGLSDRVEIDTEDLFVLGDPKANLPIYAGDLVHVLAVREVVVHFLGQVATVGSQTFTDNKRVTLLTAIARAGGLTETASNKLVIKREGEDGRRFEIPVDYRKLLNGRIPDVELQDGDLIVVKESFF